MLELRFVDIKDAVARENFQKIQEEFRDFPLPQGKWKFFEVSLTQTVTNFKFKHNLGFMPKDIIQTSQIGSGSLTFNYALFDKNFIDLSTTGPVTVRFFAGAYSENTTV